jgi:Fe-S cluster biogenesis protein NfuA
VTDLVADVAAVLRRTILPSVIARGGGVEVAAVEDGVVSLSVTGSPGAVFPLASRIEAAIRTAVPGITSVRFVTPDAGSAGAGDLAAAARSILDAEVNGAIAAHRGHVTVVSADDGWIRVRLDGGCQGCSLAEVTVRQGIEPLLRARLPAMTGVLDVTDHEAGTDPFFSPGKR